MDRGDSDLIKDYLEGDDQALKFLIEKYTSLVYNYVARFVGSDTAPDIVQDVFIKVWKNLKKYDVEKANFKTWLFTIARNTITDYLRKKKMITFSTLDTEEDTFESKIEDEVILPLEALIQMEDKVYLNKLLDQISDSYREVLILYYQDELNFREIGEILGKPLNTVKSYHHRALVLLRQLAQDIPI